MIKILVDLPTYLTTPLTLIGYSVACLGAGIIFWRIFSRFTKQLSGISPGTVLATAFILGEGILAGIWVLLALGGLFRLRYIALLSVLCAICGIYFGWDIFKAFKRQVSSIWKDLRKETWGWQFIAALTLLLCISWITSVGRPLVGDGAAFYFSQAKIIAYSHHLFLVPGYENFASVGFSGEMHFAALILFNNPDAARLFSWPTIIAAGIILVSLGRLVGMGRRGQWLTLSMLFSSTAVVFLSGDGKVDLFGAALGLAAYYWAIQIRKNRSKFTFLLVGLFCGFAIIAKMSYLIVMAPGIALLVLWSYFDDFKDKNQWRKGLRELLSNSAILIIGILIALSSHFIKNGVLFNNPFAPFGGTSVNWTDQHWFGAEITRRIILTYPLGLTFGSYWAQYGNLSPLLLAFIPLAYFLPRPRRFIQSPLVMTVLASLAGLIFWIIVKPSVFSPRYILATLLLLILLPARAAEYISFANLRPRILSFGVVTATPIVLVSTGLFLINSIFYPSSIVLKTDECTRDGVDCVAMNVINNFAKEGERIYLASYNHYWFRGDLMECLSSDQSRTDSVNTSIEDQWIEFYEEGYSYIYIDETTHKEFIDSLNLNSPPDWVKINWFFSKDNIKVYRVDYVDPPTDITPAKCVRKPSSTLWEIIP